MQLPDGEVFAARWEQSVAPISVYEYLLIRFSSLLSSIMTFKSKAALFFSLLLFQSPVTNHALAAQYLLGVGVGDVTGPIVETNSEPYFSVTVRSSIC